MNFVKQIVDELSGDALGKLSALLGVDDETAESAVGAAAPSLLASLANLATQSDGTRKLTSALGSFGEGSWGNFAESLGGDTSSLFQKGGNLLNSLFSAGLINGLSGAIAKYAGINSGTAKNLLTYLAPLILGKVSALWRSRGGDASALTSFLAEQKEHITDALPAGFSLDDVPGLGKFGAATRTAGRRVETAKASAASWVVPLAILLIGALLLWNFMRNREVAQRPVSQPDETTAMKPVIPESPTATSEATALTDSLRGIFESAGETFGKIEDAATAEAAQPELEALRAKLDASLESLGKLPEMGQNAVRKFVGAQFGSLQEKVEKIGLIPTLKAEIKALIDEIVKKFKQLSGAEQPTP